jgi:hypothetical protein
VLSKRRLLVVALVAAIAVVAARVAAPSHASHFRYSAALACGVERWKVKTLQDRPHLLRAHSTPIAQLVAHERPTPLPATRLPFERHIFSVDAAVTLVRHEADEDFHLVLESGADQMIAESPSSACARGPIGAGRCGRRGRRCGSARKRASSASPSSISNTDRRASPRTRSSCIRSSGLPASRVRKSRSDETSGNSSAAAEGLARAGARLSQTLGWRAVSLPQAPAAKSRLTGLLPLLGG